MLKLEVCMSLADMASNPDLTSLKDWKVIAVGNIVAMNLPCGGYADKLLEFVCDYGGDKNAQYIRFMDAFSKVFRKTIVLGETWWIGITDLRFALKEIKSCTYI